MMKMTIFIIEILFLLVVLTSSELRIQEKKMVFFNVVDPRKVLKTPTHHLKPTGKSVRWCGNDARSPRMIEMRRREAEKQKKLKKKMKSKENKIKKNVKKKIMNGTKKYKDNKTKMGGTKIRPKIRNARGKRKDLSKSKIFKGDRMGGRTAKGRARKTGKRVLSGETRQANVGSGCDYVNLATLTTQGSNCNVDGSKFVLKGTSGTRKQFLYLNGLVIIAFVGAGEKFSNCASFTDITPAVNCKVVNGLPGTSLSSSSSCKCGVRNNNKIVNGDTASPHEFPWHVRVISVLNDTYGISCGGSLISSKTVLTAAHCVSGFLLHQVWLGKHDITKDESSQQIINACQAEVYPEYNTEDITDGFDYAILTLCFPAEFTAEVSTVCLPPQGEGVEYEDVPAVIPGWGLLSTGGSPATILQKLDMTTLTNAACCSSPYGWPCVFLSSTTLCAKRQAKGVCQGDSGGALLFEESGGYYTSIGVVSFGYAIECGLSGVYPDVFARVTDKSSWIKSKITGTICSP